MSDLLVALVFADRFWPYGRKGRQRRKTRELSRWLGRVGSRQWGALGG